MRPEIEAVVQEIEKVISGKREAVEKLLMALLAGGHVLLDDVPGVGKTTLAVALGKAVDLSCRRIQFTPDVLPSDIVGFSMYDKESGNFTYRPGMLHGASLVLGDEINRASSKTQSALLEAMEERQVTVDGVSHPLAEPFLVIATQNSVGAAGTQYLPFAQVDRFLVRLSLGYPDHDAQMAMLRARQDGEPMEQVRRVMTREELLALQREARAVVSKDAILDYITRLTMASREHPSLRVGVSPRGALFLDRAAKARACLEGRDYVTGGDVQAVFRDVCAHRVLLTEEAQANGVTAEQVLGDLLKTTESPDRHSRLGMPGKK